MKALCTLFAAAAVLLSAGWLHAQMDDRPLMSVNIPFAFSIENTRLPAGYYLVYSVDYDHFWKITTPDHKTNALFHVLTTENNPAAAKVSSLTFNRYPTDYVLREISEHERGVVVSVYQGKRAKQLAEHSPSTGLAMVRAQSF